MTWGLIDIQRNPIEVIRLKRSGVTRGRRRPNVLTAQQRAALLRDKNLSPHDKSSQMRKNPATAELLDWLLTVKENAAKADHLTRELTELTISALTKTAEDQDKAKKVIDRWFATRQ